MIERKIKKEHVKPLDNLMLYEGIFCVLSMTIWHFVHMYLCLWFDYIISTLHASKVFEKVLSYCDEGTLKGTFF